MESALLTAEDVAKQLRIKKYTVYELIKRGEIPSSRVGKQVRVSQEDIDRYLRASKTGAFPRRPAGNPEPGKKDEALNTGLPDAGLAVAAFGTGADGAPGPVIICGQDPCLDLLLGRISGPAPVLRSYMGCYNGLYALYHGRVTMAASHLWDAESGDYNYPFIKRLLPGLPVGVLRLAGRMQGFYVKKGNPLKIRDWEDLARPELTMINRERGCGTRILLDQKLVGLGLDGCRIRGYGRESSSHIVCAGIVGRGGADLGCGCEKGVENVNTAEFVPLQLEWYDFVFRLADREFPELRAILAYAGSPEFRQDLEMMGAYDTSQTGHYVEFSA
ncbi:MAG: helix-turn-helix transcriptional regulator [Treponema sp.]|jgi:putative molybdopterin biosynthesis protein|nr:helix-turn-helix transcriptional regulator [Treponema sp.]